MDTSTNFVICFDTNIYDNTKYNFDGQFYKTFKELKKEKFPNLEIYINSIIYREVMAHLEEKGQENNEVIERFKKDVWNLEIFDELQRVLNDIDFLREASIKEAKDKFNNFLSLFSVDINSLKGKLIHADNQNFDLGEVLDDYFNHRPPFENKNNKKNEFPDALIIQNISQRFKNHDNFIVVSSDNGFRKAVEQKIPKATMFANYSECANYLNKHHENYDKVCMTIEKLESVIEKEINQFLSDLTYDFVPTYHAENFGIKVDVTNYDRKGHSELSELDEMMIQKFELNDSPLVRILNIEDNGNTTAEIAYEAIFSILGSEDSSYDLINETHKVKYIVDIIVNIDTDEILDVSPQEIFLNKDSLIGRIITRDYFELEYD
ncbi:MULTISPECIES: PIN domain-containing protein [unclassified Streptococcus]|uniref:PIN domain-containing protein n=1 Tax=unclassified Streptococcus TaxID=2608887 RepID=UPI001566EFEB|nr:MULTISPECIES: PIN domain-containing protein [unclassified Streptococcus]